jgi:hypothetical protein
MKKGLDPGRSKIEGLNAKAGIIVSQVLSIGYKPAYKC